MTGSQGDDEYGKDGDDAYISVVLEAISTVMGLSAEEINDTSDSTTFVGLGGDSLSAILISAECQKRRISIPAGVFLRMPTVKEAIRTAADLAQPLRIPSPVLHALPPSPPSPNSPSTPALVELSGDESSSVHTVITTPDLEPSATSTSVDGQEIVTAKSLLGRINTSEWTEPQLLLLRETAQNPRLNTLTIHGSYTGLRSIQDVYNAWTNTVLAEPIFKDLLRETNTSPQQLLLSKIVLVEDDDEYKREVCNAINAYGPISQLTFIQSTLQSKTTAPIIGIVWRVHHAFMDGYSARIIRDKIAQAFMEGDRTVDPSPSFKETVRSLQALREERRASTRLFWDKKRELFPAAIGELRLSPQRVPKATEVSPQRSLIIDFPNEQLAAASARTGYTTTVYFAAAWALTLGKFMDADQVCFGMVYSGRDLPVPGAFDVVGPLINILPLYLTVPSESDATSVGKFLSLVHEGILELNDVQFSDTTDGFERSFNSIMATQFECEEGVEEESTRSIPIDQNRPDMQSGIPLNLIIEQQCRLRVFYSTSHYAEEDMKNLWSVFTNVMASLLHGHDERFLASEQIPLPLEMNDKIRHMSNCDSPDSLDESKGDDLVTLFENVVARYPNDTAIVQGDLKMSYDDLDQGASVIAQNLSWLSPNEAVCVYADRSVNWLIAIFGILKAGGVYAPLDPSAPMSVRQANFTRSGARVVLHPSQSTISRTAESLHNSEAASHCLVMAVDELLAKDGGQPPVLPPRRRIARADDLAYICFTSGSTGQPKAVQCTHKGLVAFQRDSAVRLNASRGTVVAQVMSPVFDGSIHEIFSTLTHGATLRLASPDQDDLFSHLQDCDSVIMTPSFAKALDPEHYPRLKNVYLVGEAVPESLCETWPRNRFLYNMYGPTEATCGATIKRLLPNQAVTLGRPNPTSRVYILDRHHRLLPPGAVGEVYLAGIQVSNGYIGLPELNADRFLLDSIMPETSQKMYKTGDYAYWDGATGEICILGRKDRQIKLNGFRLDLDDLETRVVKAIPDCEGTAIFRRNDYLVAAYQVSSSSTISPSEVKTLIGGVLPPYAIPRKVIPLQEFPLTVAGKLDYKTLEKMPLASIACSVKEAEPTKREMTATEKTVVDTIRDLTRLDPNTPIDQDSSLTSLGGHSILQLQLASRLSSILGQRVTVRKVIEHPEIVDLASAIDEEANLEERIALWRESSNFGHRKALGDHEASPIERDWFAKYQRDLGTSSFNVSHVSELDSSFDQHDKLVSAWNRVLERHEILRCRFHQGMNDLVERSYAAEAPRAVYVEELDVRATINREFSLETEHPIRVLVSRQHMVVCISHIICDYTTLSTLFEELTSSFLGVNDTDASPFTDLQRRYQDTTCWNLDVDQATASFWESYLSGVNVASSSSYMKAPRASYQGESQLFQLSQDAMPNLDAVSQSLGLTPHQIALAMVSLVLQSDSTTKEDLVLGSPFLGRQEEDMHTIGLFLQPLPIRIARRSGHQESDVEDVSIANFLQAVQDSSRSALSHGIEWNSLMGILASANDEGLREAAASDIPNHPLFDAMVTFHELSSGGQSSLSSTGTSIPGIQPLVSWTEGAKFGIMFEFSAISSTSVTLRIEYDTSLFSADEVRLLATRVNTGLGLLCESPASSRLGDLEEKLVQFGAEDLERNKTSSGGIKDISFGTSLAALS